MRYFKTFFLLVWATAFAQAECSYFRVAAKLEKCLTVDMTQLKDESPYQDSLDLPELAETVTEHSVKAICECSYSLKGSDVRCDLDQTVEHSAFFANQTPEVFCQSGASLCSSICPRNLP
jgi:hypothetical protein